MKISYKELCNRLDKPKKIAPAKGCREAFQAICPCHRDKEQSLTVSLTNDNKTLIYCHAGCNAEDILSAIGLNMSDICNGYEKPKYLERIAWFYANKAEWQDESGKIHKGYGNGVSVTAEYPYRDELGKYHYSKIRLEGGSISGKLIRYYFVDADKDKAIPCKGNRKKFLYRLPEFLNLRDNAEYVYIVEGEKDCETLRKLGQGFGCCITAGGASDWQKDFARYFKGLKVIILRDNDNAGLKLAETILNNLRNMAYSVKIVNPSNIDHGDVTDYLTKEGGTADSLRKLCDQTKEQFASWVNINKDGSAGSINTGILAKVISENEQYIITRMPLDEKDIMWAYDRGVYDQINKNAIKAIVRQYLPSCKVTDATLNNVANLLLATNEDIHSQNEMDSNVQYINYQNCLLDIYIRTTTEHRSEILSTLQYPFDYMPDKNDHPVFDRFINDLCTKPDGSIDKDEIKQIQEYCGFLVSNIPMEIIKKALVLWSRQGNTGKSALIRLISSLIQYRVASIKLTELTPDNRFILGTLPYCRLISCGDESNSTVKDSSIFKSITGGDAVKIEAKGKQAFTYTFRGGFVIACNGLPYFEDDKGSHIYDRLMILPCEHHIDEDKKDSSIERKMQQELPAIMNWCLEGLYRLIDNGYVFTKSASSERAKKEYRSLMDNVFRFTSEHYIITHNYDDRIPKKDFDDAYHRWASADNTIKEVERKNLAARLEAMGITNGLGNCGDRRNITVYRGIKEKLNNFVSISEDYELPFE